jgi:hypothetical protein
MHLKVTGTRLRPIAIFGLTRPTLRVEAVLPVLAAAKRVARLLFAALGASLVA